MYSFQSARRNQKKHARTIRVLLFIIFLLILALVALIISFRNSQQVNNVVGEMISARAISEAGDAQTTVYRLTQSSGTNTMTLLSNLRAHLYALQSLNTLSGSIYGAGTVIVEPELLSTALETLDSCEVRLQAGRVLTDLFTTLRDQVNDVAAVFGMNGL